MQAKLETEVSKFMSYVLRHAPEAAGLTLDAEGWVPFDAFEKALSAVADVPGAAEVAVRTVPELRKHCLSLLERLRQD